MIKKLAKILLEEGVLRRASKWTSLGSLGDRAYENDLRVFFLQNAKGRGPEGSIPVFSDRLSPGEKKVLGKAKITKQVQQGEFVFSLGFFKPRPGLRLPRQYFVVGHAQGSPGAKNIWVLSKESLGELLLLTGSGSIPPSGGVGALQAGLRKCVPGAG